MKTILKLFYVALSLCRSFEFCHSYVMSLLCYVVLLNGFCVDGFLNVLVSLVNIRYDLLCCHVPYKISVTGKFFS